MEIVDTKGGQLDCAVREDLYKDRYRVASARLKDWDYASNAYYYITICVKDHLKVFGEIENGMMVLSDFGMIAEEHWHEIAKRFPFVKLDEGIVMPNHIHGIIEIDKNVDNPGLGDRYDDNYRRDAINRVSTDNNVGMMENDTDTIVKRMAGGVTQKSNPMLHPYSISKIIRWYKDRVSFRINNIQNEVRFAWQPRFYDHIIRNDHDLDRIRHYIINNPLNWTNDDPYNER